MVLSVFRQMLDRGECAGTEVATAAAFAERCLQWWSTSKAAPPDVSELREFASAILRAVVFRYAAHARAQGAFGAAQRDEVIACRLFAEQVDAIAIPFPYDWDMQNERALAWCCVSFAHERDPLLSCAVAQRLDAIAAPFPDDRQMQLNRARAWSFVTVGCSNDPAVCRRVAELMDSIAARFPDDQDMQTERAQAWRYVTVANESDPAACHGFAELVEFNRSAVSLPSGSAKRAGSRVECRRLRTPEPSCRMSRLCGARGCHRRTVP